MIHRDIKPSNLLLAPDGRLSVNDFGLARILEQPGMTMSGEFVGTPRYMSPEQISAGRTRLDHRTDIYSLGATLYELLTLQPPFPGKSRDQVIGQILHKEPMPPRRLNKNIPADLETICLKAIERDPDRRYQTAGQLADDLRAFTNRFAISARRTSPLGRALKWVRRNRAISLLLLLLLVAVAFVGVMWYGNRLDRRHRIYRHFDVWALQLLGKTTDARELAEETKKMTKQLERLWPHFRIGDLASGASEDEILSACSEDRVALAHAHFGVGVNRLAKGDRPGARTHFIKCLETNQFPNYVHSWSAAFLERMNDDPDWLPWLPGLHGDGDRSDSVE